MLESFDIAAKDYDKEFTNSIIGKSQRSFVYRYLTPLLQFHSKKILELNCGTGEDALWLAKQGHKVLATDISSAMITVAKRKNYLSSLRFEKCSIQHVDHKKVGVDYDMVFSNFGGINCLSENEIKGMFKNLDKVLNVTGNLILVIMSKNCIWENLYFKIKNDSRYRRRQSVNGVKADVNGVLVQTWYYKPKDLIALIPENWRFKTCLPIGLFVPPSYLNPFFERNRGVFKLLHKVETLFHKRSFLANYADHYLIHFTKQ